MLKTIITERVSSLSLAQVLIVFVLMVTIIVIFSYRNRIGSPLYWAISEIEVFVFSYLWLFLAQVVGAIVITHTCLPMQVQDFIINIANALLCLVFCILLIIIERYQVRWFRSRQHKEQLSTSPYTDGTPPKP